MPVGWRVSIPNGSRLGHVAGWRIGAGDRRGRSAYRRDRCTGADGRPRTRGSRAANAAWVTLRLTWSILRRLFARRPVTVPVAGPPGSLAVIAAPVARPGFERLASGNAWRNGVDAGGFAHVCPVPPWSKWWRGSAGPCSSSSAQHPRGRRPPDLLLLTGALWPRPRGRPLTHNASSTDYAHDHRDIQTRPNSSKTTALSPRRHCRLGCCSPHDPAGTLCLKCPCSRETRAAQQAGDRPPRHHEHHRRCR